MARNLSSFLLLLIGVSAAGAQQIIIEPVPGQMLLPRVLPGASGTSGGGSNNATSLQGVNISASGPTSGQVLGFNGAVWIPTTPTANATQLQGFNISASTPTTGQGLVYNGTTWAPANPTSNATQLQGTAVSSTTPTTNQGLVFNGTQWAPGSPTTNATSLQTFAIAATTPTTNQALEFNGTQYVPTTMYTISNGFGTQATGVGSLGVNLNLHNRAVTINSDIVLVTDNIVEYNLGTSSPTAVSLPIAGTAGFIQGWSTILRNNNSSTGVVNVTPSAPSQINWQGALSAGPLPIPQGKSCQVISDGTNWQVGICL
jgi:hypothetical protein